MKKFTSNILLVNCVFFTMLAVNMAGYNHSELKDNNIKDVETPFEVCYATSVIMFEQGLHSNGSSISSDRSDSSKALGVPDASNAVGGFVSLGTNGYIILGFDGAVFDMDGEDIMIYETSYAGDNCTTGSERAFIELSQDGISWYSIGEVCRDESIDIALSGLNYITQIKITDISVNSPDGYDVDGIIALNGCQDIPAGCSADYVVDFELGTMGNGQPINNPNRSNPNQALGNPENNSSQNYVSLGYPSGFVTLGFNGAVLNDSGDDFVVFETTPGGSGQPQPESADVYVSQDGNSFYFVGTVYNTDESSKSLDIDDAESPFTLPYITQIKFVNSMGANGSNSNDGFDLDGVLAMNCSDEVPQSEYNTCSSAFLVPGSYIPGPTKNGGTISSNRMDPKKALGTPEVDNTMNFVSLGYGGEITMGFTSDIMDVPGNDIIVVETTFGNPGSSYESANVFASLDGITWNLLGSMATDESHGFDIAPMLSARYIKVVDTTPTTSPSDDAFDLDGIISLSCGEFRSATCNPSAVVEYDLVPGTTYGGGTIDAIRTDDPSKALVPQMDDTYNFYTIGYGGQITLEFDGAVANGPGADLKFFETSFNQPLGCAAYPEYADVLVSQNGVDWYEIGTVCKTNNVLDISSASSDLDYIFFVKLINGADSSTHDGYDLDGVIALHDCPDYVQPSLMGDIDDVDSEDIQMETSIYPNPTSSTAKIAFITPETSDVTIEVYNVYGSKVATMQQTQAISGKEYQVDFDGSNLPNGMYLYKVTTNNQTVTKRIMISH